MSYVYVLKSLRNNKRYVGSTNLLPEERLKKHNYGSNIFTKRNGPFVLVYKEEYIDKTEARKRENFLKSGVGRKFLDEIFQLKVDSPLAKNDQKSSVISAHSSVGRAAPF